MPGRILRQPRETSIAAPALRRYLAEGSTAAGFNLFYLLQNPNAAEAQVLVRYLRPSESAAGEDV